MKLDIAKCGMCGNAFVGMAGSRNVCEHCREAEDELYRKVRTLIRDNPGHMYTVKEAANLLRVSEKQVNHLVDSGLVNMVKDKQFLGLIN